MFTAHSKIAGSGLASSAGNTPSFSGGPDIIGAIEYNFCADCCTCFPKCCAPIQQGDCCSCICPGLAAPKGPEWEAALAAGFQAEIDKIPGIVNANAGCCGCPDPIKLKGIFDKEWTEGANAALKEHGLMVEVSGFFSYNGQSSQPHLFFQFKKLPGSTVPAEIKK